ELGVLALAQKIKPAMAPAEGRRVVDAQAAGRLADAEPVLEGARVAEPDVAPPQPGERGAGQRVEGPPARRAAKALQPVRRSPALRPCGLAMRAAGPRLDTFLDHPIDGRRPVCGSVKSLNHLLALPSRQARQA